MKSSKVPLIHIEKLTFSFGKNPLFEDLSFDISSGEICLITGPSGVGKTTLTFNYGEWLSRQGKNVLLIDCDHQCSLSQTYNLFTTGKILSGVTFS